MTPTQLFCTWRQSARRERHCLHALLTREWKPADGSDTDFL